MSRSLKILALCAAMLLPLGLPAHAAEILQPPIVEEPPINPCCPFTGWYLRGDVGFGIDSSAEFSHAGVTAANGAFIGNSVADVGFAGVGIGYEFSKWFRADVTAEFRGSQEFGALDQYQFDCTAGGLAGIGSCGGGGVITRNNIWSGRIKSSVFMANAYLDVNLGCDFLCGLIPYVGGGVGVARNTVSGVIDFDPSDLGGGGAAAEKTTWNLAWALQAGVAYDVSDNLTMEIGYRYLDLGEAESGALCVLPNCNQSLDALKIDDIVAQEVKIGMRWRLGDSGGGGYDGYAGGKLF
jgi:opacity protein-like surface antigen